MSSLCTVRYSPHRPSHSRNFAPHPCQKNTPPLPAPTASPATARQPATIDRFAFGIDSASDSVSSIRFWC